MMERGVDLKVLKDGFDVVAFLEDRGIRYWTDGDNVGDGWVGMKCLFCGDHFNHMGVRLDGAGFHCWLCGTSGDVVSLIRAVDGSGFSGAKDTLGAFRKIPISICAGDKGKGRSRNNNKVLPDTFLPLAGRNLPQQVASWLGSRRFTRVVCDDYGLGWVPYGNWGPRLVAPVVMGGRVVSFQAIDVTGKAKVKYKDCPKDRALIPNKDCLYGVDQVGDSVILVEGLLDKWRMGKDAVALFGKKITPRQFALLREMRNKRIRILLDADAEKEARALALDMKFLANDVELLLLDSGDPADLDDNTVRDILTS